MAKLVQKGLDLTVGTWADLQALPARRKVDGVQVTVLDAIGDSRTVGGSVVYQYIEAFAGTAEEWMVVGSSDEEVITTVEENLVVSGGKVTITDTPNGNILFDVIAKWQENGDNFVEDVAYSLSGKDVYVSSVYNGKTLGVKYLKNNSGKLYQLGASGGTGGVSSWNDLTDKPTTLLGYGVEAEVNGLIADAIADVVNMAPESLNTLKELADGLGTVYTSTQTDTKINETVTAMFVAPATVETAMMSLDV